MNKVGWAYLKFVHAVFTARQFMWRVDYCLDLVAILSRPTI